MLSVITDNLNFERFFGFKNKIKWFTAIKIVLYHLLCVYWVCRYAFPMKIMTLFFAILMSIINGVGITCGVHRLFTHKSYKVIAPLKVFLLVCFTSAGQNSVYQWIRDHRLHHKFSDTDADPHNASRGFFFSHVGWLMTHKNNEVIENGKKIDMSDVKKDNIIMFFHRYSLLLNFLFCFFLPTMINILVWKENWRCAVAWQCFIRFLFVFHCELSVNSFAHIYGYTPYNRKILPKQNVYVAATTLGEGWHNYHHVFPYDYKAAEFFDRFNFSASLIKWWEQKGWAYDLKEATSEMVDAVIKRMGDGEIRTEN